MEKKETRWCSHIGMAQVVAFQKKEKVIMLLLFGGDIDQEIENAGPKDWIEVKAQWRNVGPKTGKYKHTVRFKKGVLKKEKI